MSAAGSSSSSGPSASGSGGAAATSAVATHVSQVVLQAFARAQEDVSGGSHFLPIAIQTYNQHPTAFVNAFLKCTDYVLAAADAKKKLLTTRMLSFVKEVSCIIASVENTPICTILRHICTRSNARDNGIRERATQLLATIFHDLPADTDVGPVDTDLTATVLARCRDRIAKVRAAGVSLLGDLRRSNFENPQFFDVYYAALRYDLSPFVRATATTTAPPFDAVHQADILEAVMERSRDVDASVRQAALTYFTKSWRKFNMLPPEARGKLLSDALRDSSSDVRAAAVDLVKHLVERGGQAEGELLLLEKLAPHEYPEYAEQVAATFIAEDMLANAPTSGYSLTDLNFTEIQEGNRYSRAPLHFNSEADEQAWIFARATARLLYWRVLADAVAGRGVVGYRSEKDARRIRSALIERNIDETVIPEIPVMINLLEQAEMHPATFKQLLRIVAHADLQNEHDLPNLHRILSSILLDQGLDDSLFPVVLAVLRVLTSETNVTGSSVSTSSLSSAVLSSASNSPKTLEYVSSAIANITDFISREDASGLHALKDQAADVAEHLLAVRYRLHRAGRGLSVDDGEDAAAAAAAAGSGGRAAIVNLLVSEASTLLDKARAIHQQIASHDIVRILVRGIILMQDLLAFSRSTLSQSPELRSMFERAVLSVLDRPEAEIPEVRAAIMKCIGLYLLLDKDGTEIRRHFSTLLKAAQSPSLLVRKAALTALVDLAHAFQLSLMVPLSPTPPSSSSSSSVSTSTSTSTSASSPEVSMEDAAANADADSSPSSSSSSSSSSSPVSSSSASVTLASVVDPADLAAFYDLLLNFTAAPSDQPFTIDHVLLRPEIHKAASIDLGIDDLDDDAAAMTASLSSIQTVAVEGICKLLLYDRLPYATACEALTRLVGLGQDQSISLRLRTYVNKGLRVYTQPPPCLRPQIEAAAKVMCVPPPSVIPTSTSTSTSTCSAGSCQSTVACEGSSEGWLYPSEADLQSVSSSLSLIQPACDHGAVMIGSFVSALVKGIIANPGNRTTVAKNMVTATARLLCDGSSGVEVCFFPSASRSSGFTRLQRLVVEALLVICARPGDDELVSGIAQGLAAVAMHTSLTAAPLELRDADATQIKELERRAQIPRAFIWRLLAVVQSGVRTLRTKSRGDVENLVSALRFVNEDAALGPGDFEWMVDVGLRRVRDVSEMLRPLLDLYRDEERMDPLGCPPDLQRLVPHVVETKDDVRRRRESWSDVGKKPGEDEEDSDGDESNDHDEEEEEEEGEGREGDEENAAHSGDEGHGNGRGRASAKPSARGARGGRGARKPAVAASVSSAAASSSSSSSTSSAAPARAGKRGATKIKAEPNYSQADEAAEVPAQGRGSRTAVRGGARAAAGGAGGARGSRVAVKAEPGVEAGEDDDDDGIVEVKMKTTSGASGRGAASRTRVKLEHPGNDVGEDGNGGDGDDVDDEESSDLEIVSVIRKPGRGGKRTGGGDVRVKIEEGAEEKSNRGGKPRGGRGKK